MAGSRFGRRILAGASPSEALGDREYCSYNSEDARANYFVTGLSAAKNWGFVRSDVPVESHWRVFQDAQNRGNSASSTLMECDPATTH